MADENDRTPEDEFRDMIRDILSGKEGVDASQLAAAAGLHRTTRQMLSRSNSA